MSSHDYKLHQNDDAGFSQITVSDVKGNWQFNCYNQSDSSFVLVQ